MVYATSLVLHQRKCRSFSATREKFLTERHYWIPSNTQNLCLPVAAGVYSFFTIGMGRLMCLNIAHWKVQSLWEYTTFYSTVTYWYIVSWLAPWLVTLSIVSCSSIGTMKQSEWVLVGSNVTFCKSELLLQLQQIQIMTTRTGLSILTTDTQRGIQLAAISSAVGTKKWKFTYYVRVLSVFPSVICNIIHHFEGFIFRLFKLH